MDVSHKPLLEGSEVESIWRAGFSAGTRSLSQFLAEISDYATLEDLRRIEQDEWEKVKSSRLSAN
jgi:hypothetical protein